MAPKGRKRKVAEPVAAIATETRQERNKRVRLERRNLLAKARRATDRQWGHLANEIVNEMLIDGKTMQEKLQEKIEAKKGTEKRLDDEDCEELAVAYICASPDFRALVPKASTNYNHPKTQTPTSRRSQDICPNTLWKLVARCGCVRFNSCFLGRVVRANHPSLPTTLLHM